MNRRQFLVMGSIGISGLAGCAGSNTKTEGAVTSVDSEFTVELDPVVSGVSYPVGYEPDLDSDIALIADKSGKIYIQEDDSLNEEPVLDLSGQLAEIASWEQGLVGFAVHPSFESNRRIYVRYSGVRRDGTPDEYSHTAVLAEFEVPEDFSRIDPASERTLLEIPEPGPVHNGGGLVFGPEGYLYVGVGDGGGGQFDNGLGHAEDWYDAIEGGNGQDITENLHSSILRIDVTERDGKQPYGIPSTNPLVGRSGLDEQYAWGLRNPHQMSWTDGKLIAGDVGQDNFEEINVIERGGNYGWNVREGQGCLSPEPADTNISTCPETTPDGENLVDPVAGYAHRESKSRTTAVIPGYVYAGEAIPALNGFYVFGDLFREGRGHIFAADPTETEDGLWTQTELTVLNSEGEPLSDGIISFTEDQTGELYVATYDFQQQVGSVSKLVPAN